MHWVTRLLHSVVNVRERPVPDLLHNINMVSKIPRVLEGGDEVKPHGTQFLAEALLTAVR